MHRIGLKEEKIKKEFTPYDEILKKEKKRNIGNILNDYSTIYFLKASTLSVFSHGRPSIPK